MESQVQVQDSIHNMDWETIRELGQSSLPLKKRPIVIVQIQDEPNLQKFNAVIVKIDSRKRVWVRYLDNPQVEGHHWWTGNMNNEPGLDPQVYRATFLGDKESSMEGLKKSDFVDNGYDDIFDFSKDARRFFKGSKEYPFLGGKYGNVHTNRYYNEIQTSGFESYFKPSNLNSSHITSINNVNPIDNVPNIPPEIHGNYNNSPNLIRIPTFHKEQLGIFEILSRHSSMFYPRWEDMQMAYSDKHSRISGSSLYIENCLNFMKEYMFLLANELRKYRLKTQLVCMRRMWDSDKSYGAQLQDIASAVDVGELLDTFGKTFNAQITLYDIARHPEKKYEIEYYEYGNLEATNVIIIYSVDGHYEEIRDIS